jgi:hypothetical protein
MRPRKVSARSDPPGLGNVNTGAPAPPGVHDIISGRVPLCFRAPARPALLLRECSRLAFPPGERSAGAGDQLAVIGTALS